MVRGEYWHSGIYPLISGISSIWCQMLMFLKFVQTPAPPDVDEQCEEDLLTNPTADRGEGGRPRPRLTVGGCVYVVGGNCVEHGPGAKRYWHPTTRTDVGPDGIVTRTRGREYYYECNLGQRVRGRLRQARLSSFVKTTPKNEG